MKIKILILIALLLIPSAFAETFDYYINSSVNVSDTEVLLSINGFSYSISNQNISAQQMTTVPINIDDRTVNGSCIIPTNMTISDSSMQTITTNFQTALNDKSDILKQQIVDEINFQLKPSQDKFDNLETTLSQYKENVTQCEMRQYQAELAREQCIKTAGDYQNENKGWMYVSIALFSLIVLTLGYVINGGFGKKPTFKIGG